MVMGSIGGKLLLFQAASPSVGVGRIKARDLPTLYGTDRHVISIQHCQGSAPVINAGYCVLPPSSPAAVVGQQHQSGMWELSLLCPLLWYSKALILA